MIASLSYLLLYLSFGVLEVRFLLPRHKPHNSMSPQEKAVEDYWELVFIFPT